MRGWVRVATSGDVDAVRFMAGQGFAVEEIAGTTGLDAVEVEAVLAGRCEVAAPVVDGPGPLAQPVKRSPGRPSTLAPAAVERARVLRAEGLSLARIGAVLGVSKQAVWRVTDEPGRHAAERQAVEAEESGPAAAPAPERVSVRPRRSPLLREEELFGPGEWAVGGGLGWSIAPY
jgi:hypothetical protein